MPLIKSGESSDPNFFAISTASLITTFGGVEVSNNNSQIPRRKIFRSTMDMRSSAQWSLN